MRHRFGGAVAVEAVGIEAYEPSADMHTMLSEQPVTGRNADGTPSTEREFGLPSQAAYEEADRHRAPTDEEDGADHTDKAERIQRRWEKS